MKNVSTTVLLLAVILCLLSFGKSVQWTTSPDETAMQSYKWFLATVASASVATTAFLVAWVTDPKRAS